MAELTAQVAKANVLQQTTQRELIACQAQLATLKQKNEGSESAAEASHRQLQAAHAALQGEHETLKGRFEALWNEMEAKDKRVISLEKQIAAMDRSAPPSAGRVASVLGPRVGLRSTTQPPPGMLPGGGFRGLGGIERWLHHVQACSLRSRRQQSVNVNHLAPGVPIGPGAPWGWPSVHARRPVRGSASTARTRIAMRPSSTLRHASRWGSARFVRTPRRSQSEPGMPVGCRRPRWRRR